MTDWPANCRSASITNNKPLSTAKLGTTKHNIFKLVEKYLPCANLCAFEKARVAVVSLFVVEKYLPL